MRVTKEASQEPWITEDESEGEADFVHLMRPAAGGHRSTPMLRAMIKQGTMRGVEEQHLTYRAIAELMLSTL